MSIRTRTRLITAVALGMVADLLTMGDAFGYSARLQQPHAAAFVVGLVALFLVAGVLNFGARRTFAIAGMVWAGMLAVHTVVLIAETSRDPTSHNLWPFEYLFMLLLVMPALIGAATGRLANAVRDARIITTPASGRGR